MARYELWAPNAQSVDVEVAGRRHAMVADDKGLWAVDVPDGADDGDYAFAVDNDPARPDPRSPFQPAGVHGPSRRVDHTAFEWTDAGWQARPLSSAVIYELHIGTFSGAATFDGAIGHLDHVRDLGATHVELMPVAEFAGDRGWGYDGVDLYAPHHAYGGPGGLKRLVDACHARGLGVILDVVYNHLGPEGNYLAAFGPYFTGRFQTPWGQAMNFDDAHSDRVRRFVLDNAVGWLRDYHIDGLRIDSVHAIFDMSAVHIMEQLAGEVRELEAKLGRRLVVIAESDLNDPRLIRPTSGGGYGMDAQWCDDFHHALHAVVTGEHNGYYADFGRLADLAKAMRHGYVYDGRYSAFRRRRHGRPAEGLGGHRFVVCLQNHDQVGNRAAGDRITALVGAELQKVAAAVVMFSPFVPLVFAGEEWAAPEPFQYFTSVGDPELGRAISRGRRSEFASFGWSPEDVPDPQDVRTFERSRLDWSRPTEGEHAAMLGWYRALIALRRRHEDLTDGLLEGVRTQFDERARWLVVQRGRLCLACNFSDAPVEMPLPAEAPVDGRVVLESKPGGAVRDGRIGAPSHSAIIYGVDS